ncbi:hypothetical protein HWV23_05235 [Natronomonas halophila]|uniref:hypothetical protein n=1 Tax=Natronomonas halophila TaxID=2747817 RepID=UPI0015B41536|nr:hypothetical protein [Natronomonas halophila]QLD85150.1 hypothetical protein HWV23_05235 [Natronomonas halophila]
MVTSAFVSAVVMGLLIVGVFAATARLNAFSPHSTEAAKPEVYREGGRLAELEERPGLLGTGFVVVTLLVGLVTVGAVGGFPMLSGLNPFSLIMGGIGLIVASFLFLGPYAVVRQNGLGNALGIGAGIAGLGFAFLALIVAQLVYGVV